MTKKAIIIGAGISGPILAIQLKDSGYEVELYEARSEQNTQEGLFMGITPNGLNILRHFVDLNLLKKNCTTGSMQFYNQTHKLIATLDNSYQNEKYGSEIIQIKRYDLNVLIKKAAKEKEIPIHFDKRCIKVQENAEKVSIQFEDGSQAEADLIFGADGTFSAVRKAVFPDADPPEYTRNISAGGYARLPQLSKPLPATQMIFGERAFFAYNVSNQGEIWWFNNYYRKAEPDRTQLQSILNNEIVPDLLKLHKNDPSVITDILKSSYDFMAYPIYDMPKLSRWHTQRVCLLGDAAHAIAPHLGQGASLALEDTVCIVSSLRSEKSVYEAFAKYQKQRQPRVEKIIKGARKVGNQKSKPNRLATWFRDRMLGFFIKQTIRQTDWIYSYRAFGKP